MMQFFDPEMDGDINGAPWNNFHRPCTDDDDEEDDEEEPDDDDDDGVNGSA